MLAERGLAPHLVPDVVTSLATGRAVDLLTRGHTVRTVRQTLVQRGLSDSDAKYIVEQATANLSRKLHSFGIGKWKSRVLGIGATCFMIGFGLFFAAKIGSPIVPDAIWAIMLGAGAILSAFGGLALVIDQVWRRRYDDTHDMAHILNALGFITCRISSRGSLNGRSERSPSRPVFLRSGNSTTSRSRLGAAAMS